LENFIDGSIPYSILIVLIMEFSIDIHTELTGKIILEDFSKEYG